ncbi:MAG: adenylyl-sulfate kinase [Oligoflexia bacterium]|nr:adenylyl-sulfate kinase [Oligoflexia bacterium]
MNDFDVIATLNLHLLNKDTLEKLFENGATIFRINGSHIRVDELNIYSSAVREALGKNVKILIDLPGNKIRTSVLSQPIILQAGKTFDLRANQINYSSFLKSLALGDILLANDSLFKFKVEKIDHEKVTLLSYTDGILKSNKGIHLIGKEVHLPFLFDRDRALIDEAKKCGVDYIGFSFVRTSEDIKEGLERIKDSPLKAIFKIETSPAVKNLDSIIKLADDFLVDRGDLSCDIGIENVDRVQKYILKTIKRHPKKKVFFATQFFHSMLENNVPLIAEICGFSDAVNAGVDGIQLSEETAVGKYPVEILQLIRKTLQSDHVRRKIKRQNHAPVLWFTGISGSGKTTLARKISTILEYEGLNVSVIDGDEFRDFWGSNQDYSKVGRKQNQKNVIQLAEQMSKHAEIVLVSTLSPFKEMRTLAREKIKNFHEIYISCPIEECKKRDPKGHYKNAHEGKIKDFVGVSGEVTYEIPENPELEIETFKLSEVDSVNKIIDYLLK